MYYPQIKGSYIAVCEYVSYVANYAHLPYFSQVCLDAMYDSATFENLARFTASTSVFGMAMVEVFKQNNWKKVRMCIMNNVHMHVYNVKYTVNNVQRF